MKTSDDVKFRNVGNVSTVEPARCYQNFQSIAINFYCYSSYVVFFLFPLLLPGVDPREGGARGGGGGGTTDTWCSGTLPGVAGIVHEVQAGK